MSQITVIEKKQSSPEVMRLKDIPAGTFFFGDIAESFAGRQLYVATIFGITCLTRIGATYSFKPNLEVLDYEPVDVLIETTFKGA